MWPACYYQQILPTILVRLCSRRVWLEMLPLPGEKTIKMAITYLLLERIWPLAVITLDYHYWSNISVICDAHPSGSYISLFLTHLKNCGLLSVVSIFFLLNRYCHLNFFIVFQSCLSGHLFGFILLWDLYFLTWMLLFCFVFLTYVVQGFQCRPCWLIFSSHWC